MSSAAPTAAPGAASSPCPASTGGGGGGGSVLRASNTFWCYVCDMSVALVFSSPALLCPLCGGDFLEEMEEPQHRPPPSGFRRRLLSGNQAPPRPERPHGEQATAADDIDAVDYLRDLAGAEDDDEVFDRLVNRIISDDDLAGRAPPPRLAGAEDVDEVFDRIVSRIISSDDLGGLAPDGGGGGARPASKSAVEAIPTVQITEAFLAADPSLLCAVCKDEFAVKTEGRRLPCGHIYHPGCILPWLSQHNSCPICRFLLPAEEVERRRLSNRTYPPSAVIQSLLDRMEEEMERDMREIHSMVRSVFPGDGDDPEDAEDGLMDTGEATLRRFGRSSRLSPRRSRLSAAATSSPAQLVQPGIGSEVLANDPDTVSSRYPFGEVTIVRGSGTGAGGRVDEEGDVVMSEAGARGLCN